MGARRLADGLSALYGVVVGAVTLAAIDADLSSWLYLVAAGALLVAFAWAGRQALTRR